MERKIILGIVLLVASLLLFAMGIASGYESGKVWVFFGVFFALGGVSILLDNWRRMRFFVIMTVVFTVLAFIPFFPELDGQRRCIVAGNCDGSESTVSDFYTKLSSHINKVACVECADFRYWPEMPLFLGIYLAISIVVAFLALKVFDYSRKGLEKINLS